MNDRRALVVPGTVVRSHYMLSPKFQGRSFLFYEKSRSVVTSASFFVLKEDKFL